MDDFPTDAATQKKFCALQSTYIAEKNLRGRYGVKAGRTGSQTAYVDHSHVEHFFLGPVCDFPLDRKAPSARSYFFTDTKGK